MRRLSCVALLLAGCATGFGEEASGTVHVALHAEGDASGGVRFTRATLGVEHVELEPEAGADAHEGEGEGHAHLVAALEAAPIDLLGGEAELGRLVLRAGDYAAVHLALAPAGPEGCTLFAEGAHEAGPVRVCLEDDLAVELELALEVPYGGEAAVELALPVDELLAGLDVEALATDEDGVRNVDAARAPAAARKVRENLLAAIAAEAPAGHDHDHADLRGAGR